jgi:hypothetical protein
MYHVLKQMLFNLNTIYYYNVTSAVDAVTKNYLLDNCKGNGQITYIGGKQTIPIFW